MPLILVTNDDGYRSEGITALADALRSLGDVTIVAPVDEASAIGHALTLKRPLDLVVSGINKGWNLGDDVTYSGTVAGALEAALLGVPGLAVSLAATRKTYDFSFSAQAAATIAGAMFRRPLPPWTFLNMNVPKGKPKGFRVTIQAKRNHITSIAERHDPKGRPYYWIEEGQDEWAPHDRSDYQAVRDGYISVTPLHPDLTAHHALSAVEELTVESEDGVIGVIE